MKNSLCLGGLLVALLGIGVARGQQPGYPPAGVPGVPTPGAAVPPNGAAAEPAPAANGGAAYGYPGGISEWLAYPRGAACCGPVGSHGPLGYEVYLRTGVCFPMGDGVLGKVMEGGFMIQGGGRTLFFNTGTDAAWTIDLGVASVFLDAGDSRERYILRNFERRLPGGLGEDRVEIIPEFPVTPSSLNQTYVQLAFGRERWLRGLGDCADPGAKWRVGWDVGGRWGSSRMVVREVQPFKDVVGGVFVSLHSDLEIPCGCCIFQAGVRVEYGYIWSDILQPHNRTDLQSINVLFNAGLRF